MKSVTHNNITLELRKHNTERNHWFDKHDKRYIGVTTEIKSWFPQFDAEAMAEKCSKNKKKKEYYGKSVEEITAAWGKKAQFAIRKGNLLHKIAENYLLSGKKRKLLRQFSKEQEHIYTFCDEMLKNYDIVGVEKVIFSPKYRIVGVIDLLIRNKKTGDIVILDWKTNKKIDKKSFFNFKEKKYAGGLGLMEYVHDCNYQHYALQLNLEEHILRAEGYFDMGQDYQKKIVHITDNGVECHTVRSKDKAIGIILKQRLSDIDYDNLTDSSNF